MNRIAQIVLGAAMIALVPVNSWAQESRLEIEEVIVTAQKRAVNLQDLPVAVSAFTSQDLDRANINSVVDLNGRVPGLTINRNEGPKLVVTIRGIGHEANQNGQSVPGVAMHVDGVFMPFTYSLNADFLDIERIEVLRGPQGTVFGQNSTGGTINIITKKPVLKEWSGKADLAVGNYSRIQPRGMINIPIGETAAARFSASYLSRDGFGEIVGSSLAGTELGEESNLSFRGQFLWQPTDSFSALLRASTYESDTNAEALRNRVDPGTDVRKLFQDQVGTTDIDQDLISLDLQFDMSWATIKSITSYQDLVAEELGRDSDLADPSYWSPQAIVGEIEENREIFTQEINLISNRDDSSVDWLVGVFYLNSDGSRTFADYHDSDGDGIVDIPDELSFISFTPSERTSKSVYAQATFHLTDSVRATAGFRWTDDEIIAMPSVFFNPPNLFGSSVEKTTGKADVQWDFSDSAMVYASVITGLKPGGVNTLADPGADTLIQNNFTEEEVTSYELGLKSQYGGGKYQLNAALFHYDYDGFQFHGENFAPFSGGVGNLDGVEITGLEVEFQGLLTDNLRVDASFAWMDSDVTSDHIGLGPVAARDANQETFDQGEGLFSPLNFALRAAAVVSLLGNSAPKISDFSSYISVTHERAIAGKGLLTSSIAYTYKGAYDFTIFNDAGLGVPSFGVWDLAFSYRPQQGNWYTDLIVTNVADEDNLNAVWTNVFGVGQTSEYYMAPRQVILRFGYEF